MNEFPDATSLGRMLGGCVPAVFGLRIAAYLGGYLGLVPAVFGMTRCGPWTFNLQN